MTPPKMRWCTRLKRPVRVSFSEVLEAYDLECVLRHQRFLGRIDSILEARDADAARKLLQDLGGGVPGTDSAGYLATKPPEYLFARLHTIRNGRLGKRRFLDNFVRFHPGARLEPPKPKRYRRPVDEAELLRRYEVGNYY